MTMPQSISGRSLFFAFLIVSLASFTSLNAVPKGGVIAPSQTDADFKLQGEYSGTWQEGDEQEKLGVQVIALGKGQFRAVAYKGGLPGEGWDGNDPDQSEARFEDGKVTFKNDDGIAMLDEKGFQVQSSDGKPLGMLKKVIRKSRTLGMKPPKGAVVLFNGTSADNFQPGKMSDDGLLMQGATSKQKFGSHMLHIEFLLPYKPEARGQGRGNSGLYVQGRYEVQMLDSFGLKGKNNECGGIYEIADPDVNMCYPPLSWQTYDVDFTAAEFDDAGKKTKNARITVRHNGVVVHNDLELPRPTRASSVKNETATPGPVYLQNHGNPVRYRNIWVVEK